MINLRKDAVFRPVDWRWRRAALLRSHNQAPSRRTDDDCIARARAFLGEHSACGAREWELSELADRWGALYTAYDMHHETAYVRMRHELEARLLTGVSFEKISERMHIDLNTVRWYESLFYNVSDRLQNRSWIFQAVLPVAIYTGFRTNEYEIYWKLFAYGGGEHVLDAMIDVFPDPTIPFRRDGARSWCNNQARAMTDVINCRNVFSMQFPNVYAQMHFGALHAKYVEMDKLTQETADENLLRECIDEVFQGFPWSIGVDNRTPEGMPSTGKPPIYICNGFELRDSEQMALLAGCPVMVAPEGFEPPAYPERKAELLTNGEKK